MIFHLDQGMAQRFRRAFVRPAVQARLDPRIKAVVEIAWNDAECVLDVTQVFDPEGVIELADAIGKLVFEGGGGAFGHLSAGLTKAATASIVDRIGTLDEENPPRVYEIQSSESFGPEDTRRRIGKCRDKAVKAIARKRST